MMNIAYAFNHYYLEPTLISVFSLLRAKNTGRPVALHLLVEEDLTEEQLSPAFKMAACFGNCRVSVFYPQKIFQHVFRADGTSCAPAEGIQVSFFRLYLSKVLPDQDRCLFLDSDLIVRKDLSSLYDTDMDRACFAGVTDPLGRAESQRDRMRDHGVRKGRYINSGVLMMNLSRLRRTGLDDRLLARANETAYPYLDQDVINFTCPEEIQLLPKRYNVFPGDVSPDYDDLRRVIPDNLLDERDFLDPAIVHYIGPDKPWLTEIRMKPYWTEAENAYHAATFRSQVFMPSVP